MCGRLTITTKEKAKLTAIFPGLQIPEWPGPRYNVAPSQNVAAILNEQPHTLAWIRWGLIPRWAKDAAIGNKLIIARAETLAEKPSFRDAYAKRRCLILADGFFEWAAVAGARIKQPYYFTLRTGTPFAFAGLWERWRSRRTKTKSQPVRSSRPRQMKCSRRFTTGCPRCSLAKIAPAGLPSGRRRRICSNRIPPLK